MEKILIFVVAFFFSTVAATHPFEINFNNLMGPPKIIAYQGSVHAVFDMGGMKYLFRRKATSYWLLGITQKATLILLRKTLWLSKQYIISIGRKW